jgi:beta-1,4-N-acetylglucosaminyltransferase
MPESLGKIGLICSHGGHLTEMLELAPAFEDFDTFYFCYDADTTRVLPNVFVTPNKPYSLIQFLKNLIRLWSIFNKENPDWLLSTGAEIALPGFLIAKARGIRTLYVECGAQVTRPSMTGRVMMHLADHFYVQWPELQEVYGEKALFVGSLIDEIKEL